MAEVAETVLGNVGNGMEQGLNQMQQNAGNMADYWMAGATTVANGVIGNFTLMAPRQVADL